jgi:RTX calcium-binding nonapeptide repeat (4 copies)/Right handed beta helix region
MSNLITVTSAADSGSGSLRSAIASAQAGDTIQFAPSLANQTITLTSGELALTKSIEIDGSGAPNLTLSGNNVSRIFSAGDGINFSLKNLALVNGKTTEKGGAVWLRDGGTAITVFNCRFENNEAGVGGAIQIGNGGRATVLNSQFNGNKGVSANNSFSAGAIANDGSGEMVIKNTQFANNLGFNGGAIYSLLSPLTVENCKFINNEAIGEGGGAIFTDGGSTIAVRGSWFEGNKAQGEGGALFLYGYAPDQIILEDSTVINNSVAKGTQGFGNGIARGGGLRSNSDLTIRNVTFANNTSAGQGGGIWIDGDSPINISNSTFSGNRVTDDIGGAMVLNTGINAPVNIVNTTIVNNWANRANGAIWMNHWEQPVTLTNSIVAFNTASGVYYEQQVGYQPKDGGGNIEYPAPVYPGRRVAANSQIIDPKIGGLQEVDGVMIHPLMAGSPAINAGVTSAATASVTIDQRNVPRDSRIDIGSFELSSGTPYSASVPQPSYVQMNGSAANDVLVGSATYNTLIGGSGNDLLIGSFRQDVIAGGTGKDTLIGGLGSDRLSGGSEADRFVYSGFTPLNAFRNSMLNRFDRITDFNSNEGDRLVLDFDNRLATADLPKGLFFAGTIGGRTLLDAANAAFLDKNSALLGSQAIAVNEALLFQWNNRTFMVVNDKQQSFSRSDDLLVELTGTAMTALSTPTGTLTVGSYFA